MTPKQSQLLEYLRTYLSINCGISPTFREMQHHMGLSSKSEVFRLVQALEEQGYIARQHNRARRIELIDHNEAGIGRSLYNYTTEELAREAERRGLILGHVYRDGNGRRTVKIIPA